MFIHICHRIWDAFLKSQSGLPLDKQTDLLDEGKIGRNIQSAGILFASNEWFNKLPEKPGGNSRQNLVEKLGLYLNSEMIGDLRMSYPGGNGISVALAGYKSDRSDIRVLRRFMEDMVDYGVLFSTEHASKSKAGGRRIKFYLNPILCPRYQLPEARTKEPYYWKIEELFDFAMKAGVTLTPARSKAREISPQHTFDFDRE